MGKEKELDREKNKEQPAELAKAYDALKEQEIYKMWEDAGAFQPKINDELIIKNDESNINLKNSNLELESSLINHHSTFSIFLPPPNVTGSLHMGHALNATLSDVLIRYNRMKGKKTVWFPGTDHAGIATQNVVEKKMRKEGTSRFDLGREKFIEKVWEWKKEHGDIIVNQFRMLGASCDWSRFRFTMDEAYSTDVLKTFVKYHEKGLIYRGKRVINWCTRCGTSLSDLEVEHRQETGKLWFIKYKVEIKSRQPSANSYITVATTRPETMLGDTAVAVNPKDEGYKKLVGLTVELPITGRKIPIIADDAVDMEFGTGAVKVTPAHDLNDAAIGQRHNLEVISVINERGKIIDVKDYEGLNVLEAREKILGELENDNLIEKTIDYTHNVSVCYRCDRALEPMPSWQWFIKMDDLALIAKEAVKSEKISIEPKNFEKTYFNWLENIRDWNISRQIWWGQRLPVFFCQKEEGRFTVSLNKPEKCSVCGGCEMVQSEDVLDTWFSSALWTFAGLSEEDKKIFTPSSVMITARDIINLWVGRMIYSSLEFEEKIPFEKVFIHATILAKDGKRMSKSLGTGVDPLELIDKFGADAVRFGIVWQTMGDQDVKWDESAVVAGQKFANKVWNIGRYIISQIPNDKHQITNKPQNQNSKLLTNVDKEVIEKLEQTQKSVEEDINNFRFGQALHMLYNFIWHDLADVYIENSKSQMTNPKLKESTLIILHSSLTTVLRLLHPFMPFVTETVWQEMVARKLVDKDKMLISSQIQ